MKQKRKTLIVILLTVVLFVGGLFRAEQCLAQKWEKDEYVTSRKHQLMNLPQDSVDVLFIGASAVFAGFHPARLYEKTGIRSFNLGVSLQPPLAVYYNLQEALTRHKPKVVVIDFSFLHTYPEPTNQKYDPWYQRSYVDIQSGALKKQYLREMKHLTPDVDLLPYISPFYKYHTRWRYLIKEDFSGRGDYQEMKLGTKFSFDYKPQKADDQNANRQGETVYEKDERSAAIYDRVIQLCREEGIAVISVLPARNTTTSERQDLHKNYAKEHQLLHIDFNQPEIKNMTGVDPLTDFYDAQHVNILGARKMTDYIGDYILEQNLLTPEDHPEADKLYQAWAAEYAALPIKMVEKKDQK